MLPILLPSSYNKTDSGKLLKTKVPIIKELNFLSNNLSYSCSPSPIPPPPGATVFQLPDIVQKSQGHVDVTSLLCYLASLHAP